MKSSDKKRFTIDFSFFRKGAILLLAVFLFCVVAPHRTEAAIEFDNKSNSTWNQDLGNVSSFNWNHVTGSGLTDSLLIIGVAWRNGGSGTASISSVTYDGSATGITPIRADGHDDGTGSRHTALYYLKNPASGTKTIEVTFTGGVAYVAQPGRGDQGNQSG